MGSPARLIEQDFKELNIMVNTNSKEIIETNKKHILRQFGSKKNWYLTMLFLLDDGRGRSIYDAAYKMALDGSYLGDAGDVINYLRKIGLDDKQLMGYRAPDGRKGPIELYFRLMARDGERLFNDITKDLMKKEKTKKSR